MRKKRSPEAALLADFSVVNGCFGPIQPNPDQTAVSPTVRMHESFPAQSRRAAGRQLRTDPRARGGDRGEDGGDLPSLRERADRRDVSNRGDHGARGAGQGAGLSQHDLRQPPQDRQE